ncbi:MAG TPA: hypothetical protein PLN68_08325, partial [Elusimicrobiales bacterium]|nr:hypothetical protein [Elusimicrobiales bacterium]
MPNKEELEKMIKDCMNKKGWSYDRCKRYIAGGIWGAEKMSEEKNNEKENTTVIIEAVPILKAGNWVDSLGTKVEFSIKDLDEIAKNTNALLKSKLLEPPLKLGHNEEQPFKDGFPSLGYVANVYRIGNQLFADFSNVPKKLYELIKNKAYSKISSEVYMEFKHPETKEKIGKTLRAVSLLGADLPAIKGLGDILSLYNAEGKETVLSFSESENKKEGQMNKMTMEDIKKFITCEGCLKFIEEKMKEENKTEITTEDLAIYLTKMRMAKLEEEMKNKPEEEIICPDGYEWNGTECVAKNKETKIEGHICPKGYKWDEAQNKCVPIEISDKPEEEKEFKMSKEEIKKIQDENKDKIKDFKFIDDKRPPKGWWDKCISEVSDVTDTPEQLCGWIYYDWMSPERQKEIESTRQKEQENKTKMSEAENEIIKLQEKVKEMTIKEFKNKLEEIKSKNRDILIPALDEGINNMFNFFSENDKMIKLSDNNEISALDYFLKFLNDFANAKRVIFSEIAKNDKSEINTILNSEEDVINDNDMEIRNVKLAKLADIISQKENITYKEALSKASKI